MMLFILSMYIRIRVSAQAHGSLHGRVDIQVHVLIKSGAPLLLLSLFVAAALTWDSSLYFWRSVSIMR